MVKHIIWATLMVFCLDRQASVRADPAATPTEPGPESVLRGSCDFLARLTNFSVDCTRVINPANRASRSFQVSAYLPDRLQVFSREYFHPAFWDYNAGQITLYWPETGERQEHPAATTDFPFSLPDQAEAESGLHRTLFMVEMLNGHLANRILAHAVSVSNTTKRSYHYNGTACCVIRVEQDDGTAYEMVIEQGATPFIHVIRQLPPPATGPNTLPVPAPPLAEELYRHWQVNSPETVRHLNRIQGLSEIVQEVYEQARADCDLALQKLRNGETLSPDERERCSNAPERYYEAISQATGLSENYRFPEPERTRFYRLAILAGLVDWKRHGGWAFISEIRVHVFSGLKDQFTQDPDPVTAFCLLFPAKKAGDDTYAGQLFDYLCEQDNFLAMEAVKWAFGGKLDPDWFVDRYLAREGNDRTEKLLQDLQTGNDQASLEIRADILKRLGRWSEAEDCYRRIEKDMDYIGDLVGFYLKFPDQTDDAGVPFRQRYNELISRCFPKGLQKAGLENFSGPPAAGVVFMEENSTTRRTGLGRGTVIVALDGYQVDDLTQYYVVREMDASNPRMNLIVWDKTQYKAVTVSIPNRRFGLDLKSFTPEKGK